ncbi:PH domain-containing protein [Frigoribacterium sp. PhB118]|uniref:PH domain-containing protein n=1 Tax=Frigoribacterium sp. PhB118 TaxID=2485175 RepID=UPI000F488AA8|nr:PH domain-containing protein [Frigoribacterium sp. PhB118]ROS54045.1 putative membrane protein YdbT with pleckstrin-like domain [Frigoribacterium sp. PhB118]
MSDPRTGADGGGGRPAPPDVAALTDGKWHRLHPATPLLKGGIALAAVLVILFNNAREYVVELFVPGGRRGDEGDPFGYVVDKGWLGLLLLAVVVVIALFVGGFWLSWRMHTFRVGEDVVEVRSGIVFRTNRRARLDRIQGINIQRPLLARVFGAAKLEVTQAGQDANVTLAYLRSASADDLRREILRRAGGAQQTHAPAPSAPGAPVDARGAGTGDATDPAAVAGTSTPGRTGAPAPHRQGFGGLVEQRAHEFLAPELDPDEAPPRSVVALSPGRLIGSTVLSGYTLFLLAAVVAIVISVVTTGEWFLLFVLLPAVLGSGGFYVNRITKSLRYTIAGTRDGVRIGYGLFSTSNETLPPGRIHSIKVSQPLLWRPFGWWDVKINRASRSSTKGAAGQENTTILPVGDEDDVRRVLELVLPELVGVAAVGVAAEEARAGSPAPADAPEAVASAAVPVADGSSTGEAAPPALGGEAIDDETSATGVAAPPAVRDAVEATTEHTLTLVEGGLRSSGTDGGFTVSPRRAAVLRWFSWRRNGFRSAPGALLLRKGAIWRQLVIVPLPRVQSVGLVQGPLRRRLRLATVHLHTVQGPIVAEIGALDQDDALGFFTTAGREAVAAAHADRTHRWSEETP